MTAAFDVGILLDEAPASPDDLDRRLERLQRSDPDIVLVSDHVGAPDPFALLAFLAGRIRARLGTYVASALLRHPADVARLALTLASITSGRFRLGVGAGWRRGDAEAVGGPTRPGDRRRHFEEHLDVLRAALSGASVDHDGPSVRCHLPEGISALGPRPELLVGASGPRMLEVAARCADVVGITPTLDGDAAGMSASRDVSLAGLERVVRQLDEVSDRPTGRSLLVPVVRITDGARVVEMMARTSGIPEDDLATSPYVLVGSEEVVAGRMHDVAEQFGITEFVLPERAVARCPGLLKALRRP